MVGLSILGALLGDKTHTMDTDPDEEGLGVGVPTGKTIAINPTKAGHMESAIAQNMHTGHGLTGAQADHLINTNPSFDPSMRASLISGDHHMVGAEGSDPFNDDSENGNRQKKEEESGIPPVTLTAPTGSLQAGQWFNPLARQEYTAPAAQDWSGWMFGSPFGEQGGLLYQPWSAEYGQQYVPSNIWNWNPMEMSKATAFAPPIASTSILGDSTSVANTTANNNNNNNTVVTTDPTGGMGGGTGPGGKTGNPFIDDMNNQIAENQAEQSDLGLLGAIFGLGDFNTSMDNLGQIRAGGDAPDLPDIDSVI